MLQAKLPARIENVRLAQLDRAFGYGPKGREFESSNAQYYSGNTDISISVFYFSNHKKAIRSIPTDRPIFNSYNSI